MEQTENSLGTYARCRLDQIDEVQKMLSAFQKYHEPNFVRMDVIEAVGKILLDMAQKCNAPQYQNRYDVANNAGDELFFEVYMDSVNHALDMERDYIMRNVPEEEMKLPELSDEEIPC